MEDIYVISNVSHVSRKPLQYIERLQLQAQVRLWKRRSETKLWEK